MFLCLTSLATPRQLHAQFPTKIRMFYAILIATGVHVFIPDDTLIHHESPSFYARKHSYHHGYSHVYSRQHPIFSPKAHSFVPDSISKTDFKSLDDVVIEAPCFFLTALCKIIETSYFYKVLSGISQPAFLACKKCHFRCNSERLRSAKIGIFHNYIKRFQPYIRYYDDHFHQRYGNPFVLA